MKRAVARTWLGLVGFSLLVTACGPAHIKPHTVRKRNYDPGKFEEAPKQISEGSMWQDTSRSLVADFRAGQVGDLVTILVDESPNASGDAATDLSSESSRSMGMPKMLGFAKALQEAHPDIDTGELISLMSSSEFSGSGDTSRGSRAKAQIAVRVRRRLVNGDLFVEGNKVIMVNDEELHIYVSGVVRPQDIAQDNRVSSSMIADAQIEFTGRGVVTDTQRQGWLSRLISSVNPF